MTVQPNHAPPHDLPAAPASRGLDRGRLARWLTSAQLVDARGRVRSWTNPHHPGYPYAEAAALWLSWAAWRRERGLPAPARAQANEVAVRLMAELAAEGAVGRDGSLYLFDSCVALAALARVGDWVPVADGVRAAFDHALAGLQRFVDADSPVLPRVAAERWSDRWAPHQRRAAALLLCAAQRRDHGALAELARQLWERVAANGREPEEPYLHARAYGLEGALIWRSAGQEPAGIDLRAGADGLTALQRDDGGVPAWSDRPAAGRADATAQAVRIWLALDRDRYRRPVERAVRFLAAHQAPEGGIEYEPGRADVNTWASVFADQAAHWATYGSNGDGWI